MATLPLMAQGALLTSLAPNTEPLPPSFWPLAPGYWLIILFACASLTAVITWWFRGRRRRLIRQRLRAIRALPSRHQQLTESHTLLRWIANRYLHANPGLSPSAFAAFIHEQSGHPVPTWLNAHYMPDADTRIDWSELQSLSTELLRRADR